MASLYYPEPTIRLPMPSGKCARSVETVKFVFSTVLTLFCLGFIIYGIIQGYAVLPGSPVLHLVILIFVIILLGYLEGLQVAILALEHRDVSHYEQLYPRGCRLQILCSTGKNVSRFLMGRQFFVIFVVFLCAQITTFPTFEAGGMPEWLFILLIDTGLPGALVVLCFGQLMPQLVAQCDPMFVMNLPGSWFVVKLALGLEYVGVTHSSWVASGSIMWMNSLPKRLKNFNADPATEKLNGPGKLLETLLSTDLNHSELFVSASELDESLVASFADAGLAPAADANVKDITEREASTTGNWNKAMKRWSYGPNSDRYSPFDIAKHLAQHNKPIPRFLLPPDADLHIPPHLVAFELMQRMNKLSQELNETRAKLATKAGDVAIQMDNGPEEATTKNTTDL